MSHPVSYFVLLTFFLVPLITTAQEENTVPDPIIKNSNRSEALDKFDLEELKSMVESDYLEQNHPFRLELIAEILRRERLEREAGFRKTPANDIRNVYALSLKPDAPTLHVSLTPGYDTHLYFMDVNGQPWPTTYFSSGSAEHFPVEKIRDEVRHAFRIKSTFYSGSTNLTVMLEGLPDLIHIELNATEDTYHSNATFKLDRTGPNSTYVPSTVGNTQPDANPLIKLILNGGVDLPTSVTRRKTDNTRVDAWSDEEHLYLRTDLRLTAPAYTKVEAGTGGYVAYQLPLFPVVSMTDTNGRSVTISILD